MSLYQSLKFEFTATRPCGFGELNLLNVTIGSSGKTGNVTRHRVRKLQLVNNASYGIFFLEEEKACIFSFTVNPSQAACLQIWKNDYATSQTRAFP